MITGLKVNLMTVGNNNETELETIHRLDSCLEDVKAWMDENQIKDE